MGFVRTFLVMAALSLTLSMFAIAGTSEYGNTATTGSAKDKEDPSVTNLSWRYRQANDNLTLQALYLKKKVAKIDEAIKASIKMK